MSTEIDGVNGIIKNTTSDGDITIKGNDGGSEISALILDMSDAGTATFNHDVKLGDNAKAIFGAGSDLQIYHDTTDTIINNATGTLKVQADTVRFQNAAGNETIFGGTADGAAFLVHNDATKITTASDGVDITGDVGATTATIAGNISQTTGDYLYSGGGNFDIKHNTASQNIVISTTPSGGSATEVMRIRHDGKVGIGATTPAQQLSILNDQNADTAMRISNGTAATAARSSIFLDVDGGGLQLMAVNATFSTSGAYIADGATFVTDTAFTNGMTLGTRSSDAGAHIRFYAQDTERARIQGNGYFLVGKTSNGTAEGCELHPEGQGKFIRDQGVPLVVQRNGDDGDVVKIQQAGSLEGTISVSGTTVSYNGFTGGHWSRLADNSKPTILPGTIMESIDEMCDWYQAVADVPEVLWTADDPETKDVLWAEDDELPEDVEVGDVKETASKTVGNVKQKAYTVKEQIPLGDKSVGDVITFTSDEIEYTGTIVKEDDIKHTKSKVSDTADSKKVYGVFSNWDDADDGLDGDVNDMNIAQVGTYIIRVNKDVTVQAGDLLVSNGDGTAKVQDDDIIRSKTVAKVNSNIKVETYSDGSYTVPCTLHC